ncbi:hypothetical protein HK407_08g12540 [Ordospora pajunii]|uniref:uncharacterized protein n=1 Tax=Ordospora pajunii TaxID=3039483 RepID=UPI0029529128|nr:uncharacterized protein HK407_08g12540 [Ordospora pajunii]KAH9411110.1 hypothetical protein HK407_08g12540 [Ordospora pajunii]
MGRAGRQRLTEITNTSHLQDVTEITNTLHPQDDKIEPAEKCIVVSDDELYSIDVIDIPISDEIFDEYQITSKILEEY